MDLEYDVGLGRRGDRYRHLRSVVSEVCGAEDALVVNNNAAAVLLLLTAAASSGEVVVLSPQLVEIGGGFRIPEVAAAGGAVLREVGTAEWVDEGELLEAMRDPASGSVLLVHTSNYRFEGRHYVPPRRWIVERAHEAGLPVFEDLGSGMIVDPLDVLARVEPDWSPPWWVEREATVAAALADGVDVVTFSGDKLLGGPQCGIAAGGRAYVGAMAALPLMRAMRTGKTVNALVEEVFRCYQRGTYEEELPFYRMLASPRAELERRARSLAEAAAVMLGFEWPEWIAWEVVPHEAQTGAGAYAEVPLPSAALSLELRRSEASGFVDSSALEALPLEEGAGNAIRRGGGGELMKALLRVVPEVPVVAVVRGRRTLLDMRSLLPEDDGPAARSLAEVVRFLEKSYRAGV